MFLFYHALVLNDSSICRLLKVLRNRAIPIRYQGMTLVNPLRPNDAYMRRWNGSSLVQIMACRLFRPLSEPVLEYCQLDLFQWNFNRNSSIFIQENAFESVVWKMAAILSRPQWVKMGIVRYLAYVPSDRSTCTIKKLRPKNPVCDSHLVLYRYGSPPVYLTI